MSAPDRFEAARKVADAVLYEGYLLYPYRASAKKNQVRWQFGVLVPPAFAALDPSESSSSRTEVILEPGDRTSLSVRMRCLQVQARTVQRADGAGGYVDVDELAHDGATLVPWDEATDHQTDADVAIAPCLEAPVEVPVHIPGGTDVEEVRGADGAPVGRVVRTRWPVEAVLTVSAERLPGPFGVVKLRADLENVTSWDQAGHNRDEAIRRSLVAAHLLLGLEDGAFVSLLEPPEWARDAVTGCDNVRTWPVLVGDPELRTVMLSSPIILYDHPEVAPESPGDLYDSTEIDEILTLRTLALTDDEKAEARQTDARAAAIIDRVDSMPAEMLDRLHGAVRYLRGVESGSPVPGTGGDDEGAPWWDPGSDATVSPETDTVLVGDVQVARGSRVRLRPGRRRADAQDIFLAGRAATVEAVFHDVDEQSYLAVTVDDDPAADLQRWHGRFLYFAPDEVEVSR